MSESAFDARIDRTVPQVAEMYERQVLAQGASGKKKKGNADADDGFW